VKRLRLALSAVLSRLAVERVDIADTGYDLTEDRGEIVYEVPYGRFEVTIREIVSEP
jgi:hypothetical protein